VLAPERRAYSRDTGGSAQAQTPTEDVRVSLKDIATDLSAFLQESAPAPVEDVVTEAEFNQLGRAVVDLVLARADGHEPEAIGEAMVIGAHAAAEDAGVSADDTLEATVRVVERMAEAMRRMQ
jgi:hypothetical protein